MTKAFKYVKIKFMKTQKTFLVKTIYILALTLALALSALGLLSVNGYTANAEELSPQLVLPKTNLEYYELNSPLETYSGDNLTAVLQEGKLIIYKDGAFTEIESSVTPNPLISVKQIKSLNQSTFLLSSGGLIRKVDVNAQTFSELKLNGSSIGCNYFDFNKNYLVTAYGTNASIYTLNNGEISGVLPSTLTTNADYPIAINDNDEIFFVNGEKLYKHTINGTTVPLLTQKPDKMIANGEFVYYLLDNKIFRISVNGDSQPQELVISANENFDLGKVINPTSISFKGENLLVTGDNAVQEFKILDGKLEFTGFAIAKNKTAYNRISSSVIEIERSKDRIATLDDKMLSIINAKEGFNPYDKANYTHYFLEDICYISGEPAIAVKPDYFALGDNTALLLYNRNNSSSKVAILDLESGELQSAFSVSDGNVIRDLTYQSGKYYILLDHGDSQSEIFVSSEAQVEFKQLIKANKYADCIEVDVFGNIYLSANGKVYKLDEQSTPNLPDLAGVKKLETDLGGNLFALTDTAIHAYSNGAWVKADITTSLTANSLKSFAMDYDKKQVFVIYENEELILSTVSLSNLAIDDIEIPADFITTSNNADLNKFKVYTPNDSANVYSVSKSQNGKFSYNELITDITDYALISEIELSPSVKLYALVGQDDIVLINSNEVVDSTPIIDEYADKKAFITTSVNGYYLPLITVNAEYALYDNATVRLTKEQEITHVAKLTFLDREYYFASFTINGVDYSGYVPVSYTIEILSQDFVWDTYNLESVNATAVYLDKELTNEIKSLNDGESVRVISTENGVCYIAFSTESGFVNGYISANAIKNDPSVAIRNILIIIAVMASVCGTTTYFILRKRR